MKNGPKDGPSPRIAIAFTHKAQATFQRTDSNAATINLAYDVNPLAADLSVNSLQAGIADICEREIDVMRQELTRLGEELVSQLDDEGTNIDVKRTWHDDDERTWTDTRSAFNVNGSSYRSAETLSIPADAANAGLVRAVIKGTIEQRERSIRKTYAKMLADVQMKRAGLPGASLN